MKTITTLPLTEDIRVQNGTHILYFYSNIQDYIENASSFILTGLKLGQHIILIDSEDRVHRIKKHLGHLTQEEYENIQFVNNYDFYEMYGDFHFERVLMNLHGLVDYYVNNKINVRLWGHVDWVDQPDMIQKLHTYECSCDLAINELGFTTVCSYNGSTVPSNIMTEMMKTHEYFMTDDALVRSNLYKASNKHNPTIFPSLSIEQKLKSEMDLYKQKLDFVHVVSHEVRNPLTVIKTLATLLAKEENDVERKEKLETISNNAVVIDHELSHIINTEQMLSTDALWKKSLTLALPAFEEVINMMSIKAKTENIHLKQQLNIPKNTIMVCNLIGLKLIISNLLSNAIKYSHEGDEVRIGGYVKEGHVTVEIVDFGVGMTVSQLEKLYRKYEKSNPNHGGQGIGLFMVKKLVDHFNGSIHVESFPNKGTRFVVSFPVQ